jgi:NAD(P)-dependent dehydrogenase (short-subunit alcohol dehydrogenase family)
MATNSHAPVIVTGGSSGLGAAVVRTLAARGRPVVILDRAAPSIEVPYVEVDLADGRHTEEVVAALGDDQGIGGVVTCAGIDSCGPLATVAPDAWERVVAVNLLGTAAVVRAALPALERSGGRIVTIASTLGWRALPDATAYCASKFGVVGFTRALAAELAGRIPVTLLLPGGMNTPFFDGRPEQYRPGPDAVLCEPDHVAQAVAFVLEQPAGCVVRELMVCGEQETSWP